MHFKQQHLHWRKESLSQNPQPFELKPLPVQFIQVQKVELVISLSRNKLFIQTFNGGKLQEKDDKVLKSPPASVFNAMHPLPSNLYRH